MRSSIMIFAVTLICGLALLVACSAPTVEQPTKPILAPAPVVAPIDELPPLPPPPSPVVLFKFDSSELSDRDRSRLVAYVDQLKSVNSLIIHVQGHTDARGSAQYNMRLGQRRANSVATFMRTAGYRGSIKTTSYGESMLAYRQTTDEAHRRNRRVEILTIK